jgi:hypothetical protein
MFKGHLIGEWRSCPRREAALESFARCPACDQDFLIWGPDGVMVHLLENHADTPEGRWIVQQLDRPEMQHAFGLRPAC